MLLFFLFAYRNVNKFNSLSVREGIYFDDERLLNLISAVLRALYDRLCSEKPATIKNLDAKLKKRALDMIKGVEYQYFVWDEEFVYWISRLKKHFA